MKNLDVIHRGLQGLPGGDATHGDLLDLVAEVGRLRRVLQVVAAGLCSRCDLTESPERDCVHNLARHALESELTSSEAQNDASR